MKGDTPLDYAVFQLNEAQSRCELWICAGERNEKLASGSFKPFLAHLRVAREQIGKGASFIILQAPPLAGDGSTWFTRRTVERFVRFVSTPDVLEGVSILETELLKLDDATAILISDSSWTSSPVPTTSTPVTPRSGFPMYRSEVERVGDQAKTYSRRSSLDYGGVALDGSKRDLLKAMETRKLMLQNEQKKAFSHALAAGFNIACISDLMVFANCFGAPRLWEACLKFMTLCKKKQEGLLQDRTILGNSPTSSASSIQLLSNRSESSESSEGGSSVQSKSKSRKTWDPQVMSTLQQLYSRKVENTSFMSPDAGRKASRNHDVDDDLVVGVRESVANAHLLFGGQTGTLLEPVPESRCSVEVKPLSVQAAISLFESKQKQAEQVEKKKIAKEPGKENPPAVVETAPPTTDVAGNNQGDALEEVLLQEAPSIIIGQNRTSLNRDCQSQQVKPEQSTRQQKQTSSLPVVSEAREVEDLDALLWKPLSMTSGYIFDDMMLEQKPSALQSTRRQSLCSWKTTWDSDFEVDTCSRRGKYSDFEDLNSTESKGRFFEQYQEKRQARLKHEGTPKKVEKEAKLKAMHDVLEKRKAELAGKRLKLTEKNNNIPSSTTASTRKDCGLRRSSPGNSTHSAPQLSRMDAQSKLALRKSSPGAQKTSGLTTPRASSAAASIDSKIPSLQRGNRRSSENIQMEPGKENMAPEVDELSKAKVLRTSSDSKQQIAKDSLLKVERSVKKGREIPQSRQASALSACSAVRGQGAAEKKIQRSGSDDLSPTASTADADDAESSCSCATVEAVPKTDREAEVSSPSRNAEESGAKVDEAVHKDVETVVSSKFPELEKDETMNKVDQPPASPSLPEPEQKNAAEQVASAEYTEEGDNKLPSAAFAEKQEQTAVEEVKRIPEAQPVEVPVITTMDEVVLMGKAPLFELVELDYQLHGASRTPLISLSSSLVESSRTDTADSSSSSKRLDSVKAESFKMEADKVPFSPTANPPIVGSFLPKEAQKVPSCSEPGSPRQPLFNLIGGDSQLQQQQCSKSSSHRLPHMCVRQPSPEPVRGATLLHSATHRKLSRSSAGSSGSIVAETKPAVKELKGLRKLFRFGRKSSSTAAAASSAAASASSGSDRIMWQNGWFKGDR